MPATTFLSGAARGTLCLLMAGGLAASAGAQTGERFPYTEGYADGEEFSWDRSIAPGVHHYFDAHEDGPLTVSTVTIETGREDLMAEPRSGQDTLLGRETVPGMVERLYEPEARPIAAINGDFWRAGGVPVGMFVADGTIWHHPDWRDRDPDVPSRSVFAFDEDGNIHVGSTHFEILLHGPDGASSVSIRAINFPLEEGGNTIFTWPLADQAPEPREGSLALPIALDGEELLPNTTTTGTIAGDAGTETLSLTRTRVAVHLEEPLPEWAESGAAVELELVFPELPGKVIGVIGGGPTILRDGEVVAEERTGPEGWGSGFLTTRHPRTAIGVKEDGTTVVAMVVDGRQPGRSRGVDLNELGELMREKGAFTAMNLDGGGSSTMVVDGKLSNFPSDSAGARSVTNALIFRRTGPPGELSALELSPSRLRLPVGASHNVHIRGIAADGERFRLDDGPWSFFLTAAGGVVTPFQQLIPGEVFGTIRGLEAGTATVRAGASSRTVDVSRPQPTGSATVTVEEPTSMEFQPPAMLLEPGDSLPVRILATSTSGRDFSPGFFFEDMDLPEFLSWSPERGELEALGRGMGHVRIGTGDVEASLPVAVSHFSEVPLLSFDELPGVELDLVNADADRSSLTLEHDNVRTGEAAWRLSYAMIPRGTSRIGIPMDIELPSDHPMAIGLWVYGDGKGQWMRALLSDAEGRTIYGNFTDEHTGVDWEGEWRHAKLDLQEAAPAGTMTPPYTLTMVYLVQTDQARKSDGELVLDGLALLELPEELKAGED